jgi:hypothetical protein
MRSSLPLHRSRIGAVHLAGGLALLAWAWLAWRSHAPAAGDVWRLLGVQAVGWAALLLAWRAGPPGRAAVFAWAAVFRLAGVLAAPVLEDDHFRFLWDGRQFALTGNPYAAPPAAFFPDAALPDEWAAILDGINHPHVPTIYGPVTQLGFLLAHVVAPGALWPWKLLLLAAEAALLRLVWQRGGDRAALLAAWCPPAVFETAFNAHPDVLAVTLLVAALAAGRDGRGAPALLALAAAAKVFALLLVPFVLARREARAWAAWAAVLAAAYAPFWLQGSAADLAGLRVMAAEWEFNSALHGLAAWRAGPEAARGLCAAAFLAAWALLLRRWRRAGAAGWPRGDLVFGAFLLTSPVINPWYLLWLLPFVAVRPGAAGLAALAVVPLSYLTGLNLGRADLGSFGHPAWLRPVEFGLIALALAWDVRRARRAKPPAAAGGA